MAEPGQQEQGTSTNPSDGIDTPMEALTPNQEVARMLRTTDTVYETIEATSQFGPSVRETAAQYNLIALSVLNALEAGEITKEAAAQFFARDHALTKEAANMDDISEGYRREFLETRLNAMIESLAPGQTIRVKFYDLVNFKNVNAETSMSRGDEILKAASREFKKRNPLTTGGRIGDEFVEFEIISQEQAAEEVAIVQPPKDMPDKLMDVPIRGGSIPVYIHEGTVYFDPVQDQERDEERPENGQMRKVHITPAKSVINRAEALTNDNKKENLEKHPELYLPRH